MERAPHTLAGLDRGREDANDAGINPWREATVALSELLAMNTALLGLGISLARGRSDF